MNTGAPRICGSCGVQDIPFGVDWPFWRDGKPVHATCPVGITERERVAIFRDAIRLDIFGNARWSEDEIAEANTDMLAIHRHWFGEKVAQDELSEKGVALADAITRLAAAERVVTAARLYLEFTDQPRNYELAAALAAYEAVSSPATAEKEESAE